MAAIKNPLRALRKARGLTIAALAETSGVSARTISTYELANPPKAQMKLLEQLLLTLEQVSPISKEDSIAIKKHFQYYEALNPPTDIERKNAAATWESIYMDENYPSYFIDFTRKLITWNKRFSRILGYNHDDKRFTFMRDINLFDFMFNSAYRGDVRIVNEKEFIARMMRLMKIEMEIFEDQGWYIELIKEMTGKYPEFKRLWVIEGYSLEQIEHLVSSPFDLCLSNGTIITFKLFASNANTDLRFRTVQLQPVDIIEWDKWIQDGSS